MAVISLVVPAWSVIVAFGPLIGMLNLNFNAIFIGAAMGAILGDWVSYLLGFHFKERIGQMWPLSKYPDLLPKGEAFFKKWGAARSLSVASPGRYGPRCPRCRHYRHANRRFPNRQYCVCFHLGLCAAEKR